jgi:molybdate transport system substrate-binding protein
MKRLLITILFLLIGNGCSETPPNEENTSVLEPITVTVSAAVSLKDAFKEIGDLYKRKTETKVVFNFGASGALQKQIENGAPVDVFASAGEKQMDELAAANAIETGSRRDSARNRLVLIVPADSQLNISSFGDLAGANVTRIAMGNPKTVPAGQYADQVLEKLSIKTKLQPKLIMAEDVRQVLDYVSRGETDAGIVYSTDAAIAGEKVRIVGSAPSDTHDPILYPIAIVRGAKNINAANEFVNLVLSSEGQTILRKFGFAAATER